MVRVPFEQNQAQLTFELVNPLLQLRDRNLESLCGTLDVEFFCESNSGPVKTMIHSLQSTSSGGGGIPIRLHSVWLNTMSFAGGRCLEFRRGKRRVSSEVQAMTFAESGQKWHCALWA
jgi:hypothetical protein